MFGSGRCFQVGAITFVAIFSLFLASLSDSTPPASVLTVPGTEDEDNGHPQPDQESQAPFQLNPTCHQDSKQDNIYWKARRLMFQLSVVFDSELFPLFNK